MIKDSQELIRTEQDDPDLVELAKAELEELAVQQVELVRFIRIRLLPKDPNDEKNIFRDQGWQNRWRRSRFRGRSFRMYSRYAEMLAADVDRTWHTGNVSRHCFDVQIRLQSSFRQIPVDRFQAG